MGLTSSIFTYVFVFASFIWFLIVEGLCPSHLLVQTLALELCLGVASAGTRTLIC
jgi:hypothetical protein